MSTNSLNNPKTIRAWSFFDWANSAFALVITAAIFPAYYGAVVDKEIQVFGWELESSALLAFAIAASYLLIALISPILSGIADYGGRKMFFMRFFTTMGAIACLGLFFFEGTDSLAIGLGGYMLGLIGFAGGLVFYNAFLPEIVSEDRYDSVSAQGFAYGYVGSVLLLIINIVMIQQYELFGLPDSGTATRLAFVLVGLWWLGFSQIPFRRLPKDKKTPFDASIIGKGFKELKQVWRQAKNMRFLKLFLFAFFFYSAGVQTIILLAATFAEKELNFEGGELLILILVLQIVGIVGAFVFSRFSKWKGNKISLLTMLTIWISICLGAYFVSSGDQFYVLAGLVGLVMGGIQALSRSTYSKLLPEDTEDNTSFFSFYDVVEKVAIVFGTASYGAVEVITGDLRLSVLVLAVFFLLGILMLLPVRVVRPDKG